MDDDGFHYDPSYSYNQSQGKTQDGYGDGNQGEEAGDEDYLKEEDYWTIITSFFEGKGLVKAQLESYNEFIENTIQEIIEENPDLILDQHDQHTGLDYDKTVSKVFGSYKRAKHSIVSGGIRYISGQSQWVDQ